MLLETGNNFASGADYARRCLQPQNSNFKMLKKINFKFFETIYFFNNFLWECGSKFVVERHFLSSSSSNK